MKILVIRFSSIGDIVLTTPVIRCLKEQMPEIEIHYLTKKQYIPILQSNPYITKIHLFKDNFQELIPKLKAEQFDPGSCPLNRYSTGLQAFIYFLKPFSIKGESGTYRSFSYLLCRIWNIILSESMSAILIRMAS